MVIFSPIFLVIIVVLVVVLKVVGRELLSFLNVIASVVMLIVYIC